MSINAHHPEYNRHAWKWDLVDDICDGEAVEKYLLKLNPTDASQENKERNDQYKKRAVFYAVAGYSARGLNGLLFSKWPKLEVAPELEYLEENADGEGNSIYQQAQLVSKDIIRKGRAGLVVSFPQTERDVSRQDMADLTAVATIHHVKPQQIINWRTTTVGAKTMLSLVVIAESKEVIGEDGYSVEYKDIRRELALEGGVYVEREWHLVDEKRDEWKIEAEFTPKDGAGNAWGEIPFTFVGSENDDPSIDHPPMYDLARINLGHYRNSADYEDSVWYAGQAQPWMSGVTGGHLDMMTENNMYVGSRSLLGVPEGEQFGFASAPANPLVKQAMDDKLQLMIGLGARFIQPSGPARTATEVESEQRTQHSVLSLISSNLSEAYRKALEFVGRYMNVDTAEAVFETNQTFVSSDADAQKILAAWQVYMGGGMPIRDWVNWAQRQGLIDSDRPFEEVVEDLGGGTFVPAE